MLFARDGFDLRCVVAAFGQGRFARAPRQARPHDVIDRFLHCSHRLIHAIIHARPRPSAREYSSHTIYFCRSSPGSGASASVGNKHTSTYLDGTTGRGLASATARCASLSRVHRSLSSPRSRSAPDSESSRTTCGRAHRSCLLLHVIRFHVFRVVTLATEVITGHAAAFVAAIENPFITLVKAVIAVVIRRVALHHRVFVVIVVMVFSH